MRRSALPRPCHHGTALDQGGDRWYMGHRDLRLLRMVRRRLCRVASEERGVAMVEGTLGVVLLLFGMLAAMQILLVAYASLTARSTALRVARVYALTCSRSEADAEFETQKSHSLPVVQWHGKPVYSTSGGMASATVQVSVPAVLPGAGFFGSGGLTGPVFLPSIRGTYPSGGWCK